MVDAKIDRVIWIVFSLHVSIVCWSNKGHGRIPAPLPVELGKGRGLGDRGARRACEKRLSVEAATDEGWGAGVGKVFKSVGTINSNSCSRFLC